MTETKEEYAYEPEIIRTALDGMGQSAVIEPRLAMLDEWSRFTIMGLLYEYNVVTNPQSGLSEKHVVKCHYPDIDNAAGFALSHHNLIMNFTWEESRAMLLDWRGRFYRPLMYKYKRDHNAQSILIALNAVYERNILGGSAGGSHQKYIWQLGGGSRTVKIERTQE